MQEIQIKFKSEVVTTFFQKIGEMHKL